MAIASMILGIIGLIASFAAFGIVLCIPGLIFSLIALRKNTPNKGMAVTGLTTSLIGVVISLIMIIVFIFGDFSTVQIDIANDSQMSTETTNDEYVSDTEVDMVYGNPDVYIGKNIKISGQIFTQPQNDGSTIYFQMWQDPINAENNTIVSVANQDLDMQNGDYVIVYGEIYGTYYGENAFGGMVTGLQIKANNVEVSDYITVVSPTENIKEVSLSEEQYGYSITVQKIEFAENETRVYIEIENNGTSDFSFFDFDSKLVQNGTQYEIQYNYEANYPEVNSEIMPGVTSSGVIVFPKISPSESFSLYFDGYSENYDETIETYQFNIE